MFFSYLLFSLAVHVSALPQAPSQTANQPAISVTAVVTATETVYADSTFISTVTRLSTKVETGSNSSITCISSAYTAVPPEVTVTETITSTNVVVKFETVSSTITIAVPGATNVVANGINYRRYTHSFNADRGNDGFTSSFFKGKPVLSSGRLQTLTIGTGRDEINVQLPDGSPPFNGLQTAMFLQGGFLAQESGTYSFSTPANLNWGVDNWGYFWVGDAAIGSAWNDSNAAYKATFLGPAPAKKIGGSISVTLNKGDIVPLLSMWANGGKAGSMLVTITTPSGLQLRDIPGYLIEACPA